MSGQPSSPDKSSVLMGRVGAAHGLKGQVRINSYTADPLAIGQYGELLTSIPDLTLKVTKTRPAKNKKSSLRQTVIIATLKGIDSREKADKLNGIELYVSREKLKENDGDENEDEFLHVDLIGLEARLENGTLFGEVVALPNFGAADLIEIKQKSGKTILLPFTLAVVPNISINEGYLSIILPEETDGEKR
ncbi:16S rRNA processing protein RimM [hydrothermal vent metagenome]|uniref:16S rRNA processing protein RimM n=1 Tax=hydrothermal vent metagenome TaxID=652676 RepID=A0A3B0UET4_9ZZZZ